jgi:hypothetical protein
MTHISDVQCPVTYDGVSVDNRCTRYAGVTCDFVCTSGYLKNATISDVTCLPKGIWSVLSDSLCIRKFNFCVSTAYKDWMLEDNKEVIRGHNTKWGRQCNGKKKKDKRTNNDLQNTTQKTKDRSTQTSAQKRRWTYLLRKEFAVPPAHLTPVVYIDTLTLQITWRSKHW